MNPNEREREAGQSLRLHPKQLRRLLDGVQSTTLDAEALSKLPRPTVEEALRFQSIQQQLLLAFDHWIDYVDNGRRDWISADAIHDQWSTLIRYLNSAQRLRKVMIEANVASIREAEELFVRQVKETVQGAFASALNRPKIFAAQRHFTQSPPQ